jgi:hypothetical protein
MGLRHEENSPEVLVAEILFLFGDVNVSGVTDLSKVLVAHFWILLVRVL